MTTASTEGKRRHEHTTCRLSATSGCAICLAAAALTLIAAGGVTAQSPTKPHAKAVIQIWMWGGPSQLDTFDPKPDAGYDYCGPLNKPIPDQRAGDPDRRTAAAAGQAGGQVFHHPQHDPRHQRPRDGRLYDADRPRAGDRAGVSVGRGRRLAVQGIRSRLQGLIPPYVVLTEAQGRFSEEGFLGPRYKPFVTGGDPSQKRFAVEGVVAPGISDQRQHDRRELLHSLDSLGKAMPDNPVFDVARQVRGQGLRADPRRCPKGVRSVAGDRTRARQIRPQQVRPVLPGGAAAGRTRRALHHHQLQGMGHPQAALPDHAPQAAAKWTRAWPRCCRTSSDRGLLDTTIVWWGGEFGRTPKVAWEAPWNGGRGHWGDCFSVVVAGGGFKGGHVVGASDAKAKRCSSAPCTPQDLLGSILELLGIDPDGPLPNSKGLDVKVMPSADNTPGHGRLKEIM